MQVNDPKRPTLALFYCQNTPESSEADRQSLEEIYGKSLQFYPIACSGRLEPLHLLRALEEFAHVAYLITCPEGACRYFEGNRRARKRVQRAQHIIESIGLEKERVGILVRSKEDRRPLAELVQEILGLTSKLGPSPVHKQAA